MISLTNIIIRLWSFKSISGIYVVMFKIKNASRMAFYSWDRKIKNTKIFQSVIQSIYWIIGYNVFTNHTLSTVSDKVLNTIFSFLYFVCIIKRILTCRPPFQNILSRSKQKNPVVVFIHIEHQMSVLLDTIYLIWRFQI